MSLYENFQESKKVIISDANCTALEGCKKKFFFFTNTQLKKRIIIIIIIDIRAV